MLLYLLIFAWLGFVEFFFQVPALFLEFFSFASYGKGKMQLISLFPPYILADIESHRYYLISKSCLDRENMISWINTKNNKIIRLYFPQNEILFTVSVMAFSIKSMFAST